MKRNRLNKSRFFISFLFLLYILSITNSCKKTTDTKVTPGTNEVVIQGMAFSPGTITVTVNATVKWTNNDAVTHTVTSDAGLFDSGSISSGGVYSGGGTYSHVFTATGTYKYHCSIHPSMTAEVIVN
jgi:plastocyanin